MQNNVKQLTQVLAGIALAFGAAGMGEAAPAPIKVDAKGRLTIPSAALKQVGVKRSSLGTVFVEFPPIPGWKPIPIAESQRNRDAPATAPRLMLPVRPNGDVVVVPTRLMPYPFKAPGTPGTTYRVTRKADRVVLVRLSGGYAKAPAVTQ